MKVQILFKYHESIMLEHHRRARLIAFDDGLIQINIPEVSSSEAPIAITGTGCFKFTPTSTYRLEYRWWNGKLWTAINIQGNEPCGSSPGAADWHWPCWTREVDFRSNVGNCHPAYGYQDGAKNLSRREVEAHIIDLEQRHLIIDGTAYRLASEPRYCISMTGSGGNRGGVALLSIGQHEAKGDVQLYSLLQRDEAISAATRIAESRGDCHSLPIEPCGPRWDVLLDAAISATPEIHELPTRKRKMIPA